MIVKTKQEAPLISVVSKKVVFREVLHPDRIGIWNTIGSWFRWLVKEVWWLKPNNFHDFRGYSKKYGG